MSSRRIPESFINTVLTRTDIVDLINSRISLRKAGANFVARCPFHAEKTPSFSVSPGKQLYHCFGCGAGGNAVKFLMEYEGLTFVETIEKLAAQLGLEIPYNIREGEYDSNLIKQNYEILQLAASFFELQLRQHKAVDRVIAYLKARGLTGHTAQKFHLGYAPPGWENLKQHILKSAKFTEQDLIEAGLLIAKSNNSYDRFRNRIMFPIFDTRGRIIGFGGRVMDDSTPKYLNSPETPIFNKGNELYGLYEVRKKIKSIKRLIVVEGYMDVLALHQVGINEAVATLGTALTFNHIKLLFKFASEVIFCFDADQAGRKAAWKAVEICLPNMDGKKIINFLFLPEGEDPDSFVMKNGKEAFLSELKKAVSFADFFFNQLSREIDLETITGKTLFASRAHELLKEIPKSIFKNIMYNQLKVLIDVDYNFSQDPQIVKSKLIHKTDRSCIDKQGPKSPAVIALGLLLTYPNLIKLLDYDLDQYKNINLVGIKLFTAIAKLLQYDPSMSLNDIKENLPADLMGRFAPEELRGNVSLTPKVDAEKEFLGAIIKINKHYLEQKLEKLISKAKVDELSMQEKEELQQLLMEK